MGYYSNFDITVKMSTDSDSEAPKLLNELFGKTGYDFDFGGRKGRYDSELSEVKWYDVAKDISVFSELPSIDFIYVYQRGEDGEETEYMARKGELEKHERPPFERRELDLAKWNK